MLNIDLGILRGAIHDILHGIPLERDIRNRFLLPKLKDPNRGELLVREMQLKNQRTAGTLQGEWARYTEERFWAELRDMFRLRGFVQDAWRIEKEYNEMIDQRRNDQAAVARKRAREEAERRKRQQENIRKQAYDRTTETIEWPDNPKYRGHNTKPHLCGAEIGYIACPPQNVPTLFEDKAIRIKSFWLKGSSPTVAASNLGKGYGPKIVKYYYDMFGACSEQRPSTPS